MDRRQIVRSALTGLGVVALLLQATSSPAYEEDTHFLITFVACRAAGMTQDEALTVAAVDQGMDDSPGTVANGGIGGVIPNITEEWLWHALDRVGNMGTEGVLRRKKHLWDVALTRNDPRVKLFYLGVFFHYQQDTWAHRHHYEVDGSGRTNYTANHLSRDAYTTYNTPAGHARHGHQPDRPPFDPVVAYLCLEDTITYARDFVVKGLGREPNPFFREFKPFTGVSEDDRWNDRRRGYFFHMLGGTGNASNTFFLTGLIKAQINAYQVSFDANPYYTPYDTADEVPFESVRQVLQAVCNDSSPGMGSFPIPSRADKQRMGFWGMSTAGIRTGIDFSGRAGENSSATSTVGLQSNEWVIIDARQDLSSIIRANDGGCVYGISLGSSSGIYDYVLNVDAQGPKGFTSGSMYLNFTDESGDVYALRVFDSSRKLHTLSYNSRKPTIVKIRWSNTGNIATGRIP